MYYDPYVSNDPNDTIFKNTIRENIDAPPSFPDGSTIGSSFKQGRKRKPENTFIVSSPHQVYFKTPQLKEEGLRMIENEFIRLKDKKRAGLLNPTQYLSGLMVALDTLNSPYYTTVPNISLTHLPKAKYSKINDKIAEIENRIVLLTTNDQIKGGKRRKIKRKSLKKRKKTGGMFNSLFGPSNEELERISNERAIIGAPYSEVDPYAHSGYYMVRPVPPTEHRPDTNLYPDTFHVPDTNVKIVKPNNDESPLKKIKNKQTIQEPIITNKKRIELPGTVLTRRLITDTIASSSGHAMDNQAVADAIIDSNNYNDARLRKREIALAIEELKRKIDSYDEILNTLDDMLLHDDYALSELSNTGQGTIYTAAPNAPPETIRNVENRSRLIDRQNSREETLERLRNEYRQVKDKIKEYEDKVLTTIPDEEVEWLGGKIKSVKNSLKKKRKSTKKSLKSGRKTRRKK